MSWSRGHVLGVYRWAKHSWTPPALPPLTYQQKPERARRTLADQGEAPSLAASLQRPLPTKPNVVVSPRRGVRVQPFIKDQGPKGELGAERQ